MSAILCPAPVRVADLSAPPVVPAPGSAEERGRFAALQQKLAPMFRRVFSEPRAPRTIVVVPSMSLDRGELAKLTGASHYEERLLCLLCLLRLPAAHVVYVTSEPVPPAIVDYYMRLLRGVAPRDARQRLTMLSCHDGSATPLTEKILARPELIERIRARVVDPASAHLTCFNTSALERTLAVRLGIPLYGCDPALNHLGTKSGSRDVFRRAGVRAPAGFEHLRDEDDVVRALAQLKREHPTLRRAVVKLEEGFSGEGNAIFSFDGAPDGPSLAAWVRAELPSRIRCVAARESWESYREKFARMGGIVEAFVDGEEVRSPSAQCRIDPLGGIQIISTHDQVLGGDAGQVFLGCTFPADASCCPGLHEAARRVSEVLAGEGVIGRFGVDFLSTRSPDGWAHYAIEINLRKGGTTHPYLALQLLTDGAYDPATALYHSAAGAPCYYVASDNLCHPAYGNLTPDDLIAAATREGLHFDGGAGRGVIFHLLGALSEHGKLGAVCIGPTRESAQHLFRDTVAMLDRESGRVGAASAVDAGSRPPRRRSRGVDHGDRAGSELRAGPG